MKRQISGSSMSRAGTNIGVGVIASVIAVFTASPNAASQFGVLAAALVAACILSFALAGLALAKAHGGLPRATAIACTLFCLGLLAAQPMREMIFAALLCAGTAALTFLLMRLKRRSTAKAA